MSSTRKNYKWMYLPIIIALSLIVSIAIVVTLTSQNRPHIPPCEAMRPYIEYHSTMYFETSASSLTSADLGNSVTTIGDGTNQAKSCLDAGATVYSVKGYPITTHLAVGLTLFEAYTPTPSSSPAKP
jgi:hypothetical protein